MKSLVSIIVPTYKRAYTLKHVLKSLHQQIYRNFEVVVVFKPSGDGTEHVLKSYGKDLNMKIIRQRKGSVTQAYNLGLKVAKGEIIAFLDDDAVPFPSWLKEHTKIYRRFKGIGGVSGPALSAKIGDDGSVIPVPEDSVYPFGRRIKYYDFPWTRPLTGMSGWLIFLGRDGLVHHHPMLKRDVAGLRPSLLFMGANMSVKKEAIEGLKVCEDLVLGFCFEQLLSYGIWRRGYKILFNPAAKVLHVVHKESLGRFFHSSTTSSLRDAEFVLTFFILKSQEKEVSLSANILGLLKLIVGRIYRGREYGFFTSMHRIYGLLYGTVIGYAAIVSNALGGDFSIRNSLDVISKLDESSVKKIKQSF